MRTTFIAVQCFQCSTMQVKQQKKSSNKWTCVVCNQKQSQRKVYAQASMAKDVRLFVTSFNMSRKFADEQTLDPVCEEEEQIDQNRVTCDRDHRKRRTDWNEYLNLDGDDGVDRFGETGGSNIEPKCVTELPTDMFKKPMLRNYSSGSRIDAGKALLRLVFSKRNSTNKRNGSQDKEQIPCQATTKKETFKYSNHVTQDEQEPKPCQPSSMARVASKWIDYLTPDEDALGLKSGRETAHDNWNDGELQILFEDEMVDEDVFFVNH